MQQRGADDRTDLEPGHADVREPGPHQQFGSRPFQRPGEVAQVVLGQEPPAGDHHCVELPLLDDPRHVRHAPEHQTGGGCVRSCVGFTRVQ